jgi:lipoprotein-anchoring transpeptidase ErfK/SrfK
MLRRAGAVVLLALLVACSKGERLTPVRPQAATPSTTAVQPEPGALVAQAQVASVPVFEAPSAVTPKLKLSNPNEDGAPRVFLVEAEQPDWLQVLLPVRPNGSTGWIRRSDVSLARTAYRVRVELGSHRITVWNGADMVQQEPVGVGKANAPTPGGRYYITELLQPPSPRGPYGPYAFGLSGFSEVHMSFAGGNGVLGLHGTNDPSGLGKDVSAGCIRMSNEGITRLAQVLPLGTPVEIVA